MHNLHPSLIAATLALVSVSACLVHPVPAPRPAPVPTVQQGPSEADLNVGRYAAQVAARNAAVDAMLAPARSLGETEECNATDCLLKWQRIQFWLVSHSFMKIQTQTDVLIETYAPSPVTGMARDNMPYGPWAMYGFRAVREPLPDGRFRITVGLRCGGHAECRPKPQDVRGALVYYVHTGVDLFTSSSLPESIR